MTDSLRHVFLLVCHLFIIGFASSVFAADSPKKPHQVIEDLRQRMYATGETTGRFDDFIEAERTAATEIRTYMVRSDPNALIEKNAIGQSPLMAAAFMGYSELVAELLKSDNVRNAIDETNPKGMSAWLYANVAAGQAMWACNPTFLKEPFAWVPLYVSLPYYLESAENPYRKTRRLLEEAGAKSDLAQAKQFWQDNCKLQDERTRSKVQDSTDLLETALAEGAEVLTRFLAEQGSRK